MSFPPDDQPIERTFAAGQLVFAEGDTAHEAFVVKDGLIEIFRKRGKLRTHICFVDIGGVFGEMGLIAHTPRSATAIARTETTCYVIDDASFEDQLKNCPKFVRGLMRILTAYVREGNDRLLWKKSGQKGDGPKNF